MPELTLAPLSLPGCMSAQAEAAVRGAAALFLQTREHPSAQWLCAEGLPFVSMDDLYANQEDFDALAEAIAARVICGRDAVYAFPGGRIGGAQLKAIMRRAEAEHTRVRILSGTDYADAALSLCPLWDTDVCMRSTAAALPKRLDPTLPLCVSEMDTRLRAGELKLTLSEYYPDEHTVRLCVLNDRGGYDARDIPLCMVDRQEDEAYFAATVLLLPPIPSLALTRGGLAQLEDVVARLRAPGGCPWDAEQTHESLRKALLEEAYEVLEAIDTRDADALCEELGDLLLQIVFHAQLETEKSAFTMRDVTTGIVNKLIYRHPHVFGTAHVDNSAEVLVNWELLKKKEKHMSTQSEVIDAIPRAFPALMRAAKVQKKAADVGFDWDVAGEALDKVYEEADEVRAELASGGAGLAEELGDLLFACVNVARLCKQDSELVLMAATDKFAERFKRTEALLLADGKRFADMTLSEMDAYWALAKAEEHR